MDKFFNRLCLNLYFSLGSLPATIADQSLCLLESYYALQINHSLLMNLIFSKNNLFFLFKLNFLFLT